MRIHQKAWLHGILLEDIQKILKDLQEHHQQIESIEDREDLKSYKDDQRAYYARLAGLLQGSNMGLEILIKRLELALDWHAQQTKRK
jgi:hypothetical protein